MVGSRKAYFKAYRKKNAEKRRLYLNAWREENREKVLKDQKAYRRSRLQKNYEYGVTRRKKHPGYLTEWQRNNTDKVKASYAAYQTRKTQAGGSFTAEEWRSLCVFYNSKCLCCKKHKPLEPDHVVPVSKGGTSCIDNIQPLCRSCNARKNDNTIDYRF
jgi:5-methylcytosine-specific restriction endonuclease McrA